MFGYVVNFVNCILVRPKRLLEETKNRGERGFVLVFMSISLLVLTGVGGIGVDLGNWYLQADRLQKAADSAALAGAPYLPGNPTAAFEAASQVLRDNGVAAANISTADDSANSTVVSTNSTPYNTVAYITQDSRYPSRLKVQTGVKVRNVLVGLIGVRDPWLQRNANAEFKLSVPMGNPGNVLGAEPTWTGNPSVQDPATLAHTAGVSDYWLNIAGGKTDKVNGDKYTAGVCDVNTSDGCVGGKNTDIKDEDSRAHYYVVHVGKGVYGPIQLQVFDGAFVDVGSNCDGSDSNGIDGNRNGVVLGTSGLTAKAVANGLPSDAYDAGPSSTLCTGDAAHMLAANTSQASLSRTDPPALTVTVYNPQTDGSKTLGPKNADHTFATVTSNQDLESKLSSPNAAISKEFRKWYTVATLNSGPGDYIIKAKTPAGSYGNNHFSIRAGAGYAGSWDTTVANNISISAIGHLAVFTNASATSSSFYFAKVTDAQAGRTLDVNLFDIGDAPQPVDVRLITPRGATGVSAGFGTCTQEGPQLKPLTAKNPCGITQAWSGGGSPSYNGRNVTLHVTIPNTYSCVDDGTDRCWMKFQFVTSQPARDTTTWEILDCGKPLRLLADNAGAIDSGECSVTPPSLGTTTTTTAPTTTTTKPTTSTTKKPTTSTTVKPSTTTTAKPTTTTAKPSTPTTAKPTTTTAKPTTTTAKPTTTTTRPPNTTTTVISGT